MGCIITSSCALRAAIKPLPRIANVTSPVSIQIIENIFAAIERGVISPYLKTENDK